MRQLTAKERERLRRLEDEQRKYPRQSPYWQLCQTQIDILKGWQKSKSTKSWNL